MKKLVVFLIVLGVLLSGLLFLTGGIVKLVVNKAAPRIVGVPVSLGNAKVNLIRGTIRLGDLRIGNPDGFKSQNAFVLGGLDVQIDTKSLFSNPIIIRQLHITQPAITYEQTLRGNNLSALIKGLEGSEDKPSDDKQAKTVEDARAQPASKERKVVIENFQLRGARVALSLPGMQGAAIPLPLPPVQLHDIGRESDGASLKQALSTIFGAVRDVIGQASASVGSVLGSGAQAAGDGLQLGVESAGKAVRSAGEGAGKMLGGLKSAISGATDDGNGDLPEAAAE